MSVNSWRGPVEWFNRNRSSPIIIYTLSLWRPAHKQEHTHTHANAGTCQHACTNTTVCRDWHHFCLISLPLCPLLLSFPTCLWSSASFTFQSTACFSSSWQGSEHRERERERGSCPLWVAKRLPFERSNPLHHISHNLLCFPITLWESVSASSARLAPPLLFSSPLLIRLYLLHLWLLLLSLIPPTSKSFNSCLLASVCVVIILCVSRWHTEKYCKL